MIQLQFILGEVSLNDSPDKWVYIWNSSCFSERRPYKHLSGHLNLHPAVKWLWRSICQNKHKVLCWLLLRDRLSTRKLPKRKNMDLQDYNCVLCQGLVEVEGQQFIYFFIVLFYTMLGLAWCSSGANFTALPKSPKLQRSATGVFFHGNRNSDVLVHLESKEWPNFSPSQSEFPRDKGKFQRCQLLMPRTKRSFFPRVDQWIFRQFSLAWFLIVVSLIFFISFFVS